MHCDAFNGELNEAELKSLICNCCNTQFGSKRMMKLHERCAHRGHGGSSRIIETNVDTEIDYDIDTKGMIDVIDEFKGEYLCTFVDGHCEWMSLPNTNEAVVDFKRYKEAQVDQYEVVEDVTNHTDWMQNPHFVK